MNTSILTRAARVAAVAVLVVVSTTHIRAAAIVYDFNNTSAFGANTGTLGTGSAVSGYTSANNTTGTSTGTVPVGPAGSGVSGGATDYALDLTANNNGLAVASGNYLRQNADFDVLDNPVSMTISGWYNISEAIVLNARIAQNGDGTGGWRLIFGSTSATQASISLRAGAGGSALGSSSFTTAYGTLNSWIFFGVVFNDAADTISFYSGTTTSAVSLLNTVTSVTTSFANDAGYRLELFNNTQAQSFKGLADNFRIDASATDSSGALSLSALEAYRSADISAVPEPSTYAAFAGLGVLGLATLSRRRRNAA